MNSSLTNIPDDISIDEILESSDDECDFNDDNKWQHMTCSQMGDISLSLTPVDGELLPIAKHEIKALCHNARQIFGKAINMDIISSDCINYFLDAISNFLFRAIRQGLQSNESVDGRDLVSFIRTLVFLSIYGVTPTKFFDPANAAVYPHAASSQKGTFDKVMKALKHSRSRPFNMG